MKRLVRAVGRALGWDLTRLTAEERRLLDQNPTLRLRHLAARAAIRTEGRIGIAEARFLAELVRGLAGPGPIVEIGTLFGWSTQVITLTKDEDRELITVDNYSWNPFGLPPALHEETTRRILEEAIAGQRVRLLSMSSEEFCAGYEGEPPALFFIDADHAYEAVSADIRRARGIGARVICGHDYEPELHPGVALAVDEAGGADRLVGTLWVLPGALAPPGAMRSPT